MARQKKSTNFNKLLHAARRVSATTRRPWRTRTKRAVIKLTAGQKAERKRKRAEDKQSYKEALMEIHSTMYAAAQELHSRFPHRSVELVTTDIFQSQRLQSATKNVGNYSAFVSLECKRLNAGELKVVASFIYLLLHYQQRFLKASHAIRLMNWLSKLEPGGVQCLTKRKSQLHMMSLHIFVTVGLIES